jgi:hypothetical protein
LFIRRRFWRCNRLKFYSNASYGAYPCADAEWEAIGLTREKTAKKFLLRVVQIMIEQGIPAKAAAAASLDEIAALLQSFPRIGDFKAGQFALDLNYGPHLRLPVGNFVIAGPGARNGIDRCFAAHGKRYDAVIRLVRRYQDVCSLAAVSLRSSKPAGDSRSQSATIFCSILPELANFPINRVAELTPSAWLTRN